MTSARDDLAAQRPSLIYARQRPNWTLGVWHDATSSKETASIANEGGGTNNPFSEYVLATPAALSAHPAVRALVAEAEARGMERAAAMSYSCGYDVPDNVTFDESQMFRAGAEAALDAVSAMLRAEAATIRRGETP